LSQPIVGGITFCCKSALLRHMFVPVMLKGKIKDGFSGQHILIISIYRAK